MKEEDVLKFLAAGTHLGGTNLDFQMDQYVYKRKSDGEWWKMVQPLFTVPCDRTNLKNIYICPCTMVILIQVLNDLITPLHAVVVLKSPGVYIINLKKTWEKLLLAARAIVAIENPADVCVISSRNTGQVNSLM